MHGYSPTLYKQSQPAARNRCTGFASQVGRIGALTRDYHGTWSPDRSWKSPEHASVLPAVEFPPNSPDLLLISGDLPLIARRRQRTHHCGRREKGIEIAPDRLWDIEQEAGHFVSDIGLRAGLGSIVSAKV